MAQYQSSTVFGQLKTVKENIGSNYSSAQLYEVLDGLLDRAMEPVLMHTRMFHRWLPQVLAWYNTNSNRKITNVPKEELQTLVCMFLIAPPDKRLQVLKRMRLERNLLAAVVDDFLTLTSEYRHLTELAYTDRDNRCAHRARCTEIELAVGLESDSLYCLRQHVDVWFSYYTRFRGYMVEKFIRLGLMKAKATYVEIKHELKLDDCIQHHMEAIGTAVDKFDVTLGSLASYVGQWFMNARTQIRKEVAMKCESLDQLQEAAGYELGGEVADVSTVVEQLETVHRIRLLAKLADPVGLARLSLGIEEVIAA